VSVKSLKVKSRNWTMLAARPTAARGSSILSQVNDV
jgi:hypothetical protein